MEIGSFIEMQFEKGREYYKGRKDIARLNSGRAAICHALRVLGCDCVYMPLYQCDSVRDFLIKKQIDIKYYHIDNDFAPIDLAERPEDGKKTALLVVNYFGIMSDARIKEVIKPYKEGYGGVVIDNCQAFFAPPVAGCMNVYSARKFIGVPDGAYVIGRGAERFLDGYQNGYSSDTSLFLLQRIEYGCEGRAYRSRMENERRLDSEDVKLMSPLTTAVLDGTDYPHIIEKRRRNFETAIKLFSDINQIDPKAHYDGSCVPFVYPLVTKDKDMTQRLLENKHFQGQWWSYLLKEAPKNSTEYRLSRYMTPVTIDQRYGKKELEFLRRLAV